MSLSTRYLEELSIRYRKSAEDMKKAFNHQLGLLNTTGELTSWNLAPLPESISSPCLTITADIVLTARKAQDEDAKQELKIRNNEKELVMLRETTKKLTVEMERLQKKARSYD